MPDLTPPPDLSPAVRAIWDQTLTRLTELGRAGTTDPHLLRAHVAAVAEHNRFDTLVGATDVLTERDGHPVISPAVQGRKQAADTIARTSKALGLNRSAARVTPIQPAGPLQPRSDARFPGARWCDDHERWECTGNRKRGQGPCHAPAMEGLHTCRMHQGGNAKIKHLAAKAARRVGGVPREVHPALALLETVWYWAGLCEWLDDIVGGLEEGQVVWGMVRRTEQTGSEFPGVTVVEQAELNTYIRWRDQARRELALTSKMALDAEADAQMLRLEQAKGVMVYRKFQEALEELHLTPQQWADAAQVMPRKLRELGAA